MRPIKRDVYNAVVDGLTDRIKELEKEVAMLEGAKASYKERAEHLEELVYEYVLKTKDNTKLSEYVIGKLKEI